MPQPAIQTDQSSIDVQRWLDLIRRRHLHFLIPMFLGWLAVWGASWSLPPLYKSSTLILVEQSTMPKDYVVPNVADNLQYRLQSMTEQILSRSRLLHIRDELNLYKEGRSPLNSDAAIAKMQKDIEVELVRATDNSVSAFHIHYSAHNPALAQQVTSRLADLFINENLETRQRESEDTTKFLESQLGTARQSLEEQEDKIRAFKGQHPGELPAQVESNLQILSGLQTQLQSQEDGLNNSRQQRAYLESLLSQYRALQGSSTAPEGAYTTLAAVDQELDKLKTQLGEMSATFKDQHPEVRALKDKIARMEKLREQLQVDPRTKNGNAQSDSNAVAPAAESVGARDLSAVVQLKSQLQANQIEIKDREQAIAALNSKISDYQARLNQEPVREQQLADLTRGYDQSKASYDDLLKKVQGSSMATSLELLQQGERFRVLDPPSLPLKPDFPNRLKFCGIGVIVGLALGLVVAGAFEKLDDRVYSEAELKKLLPVPVISEIPLIDDPINQTAERKRTWLGLATVVLVFAVILAGTAFSYLKG
jgi:polysaccharide chain length determinant protein (PEP-CTERM system associated)